MSPTLPPWRDSPAPPASLPSDLPQPDPAREPMIEPLTAPTDIKPIPPPLISIWPKGGTPSYRPKLRPR